jgi:hypothetical protein
MDRMPHWFIPTWDMNSSAYVMKMFYPLDLGFVREKEIEWWRSSSKFPHLRKFEPMRSTGYPFVSIVLQTVESSDEI